LGEMSDEEDLSFDAESEDEFQLEDGLEQEVSLKKTSLILISKINNDISLLSIVVI